MSGFSMGLLKGTLVSLIGLSAASLVAPLAPLDPGKTSQVDLNTPKGSGFNEARDDTNPVLPDTDQSFAKEGIGKPATNGGTPDQPTTDTTSASKPASQDGIDAPDVDTENEDMAILMPQADGGIDESRPSQPPVLGLPMPSIDNPIREIPVNQLPIVDPPVTELDEMPGVNPDGSIRSDDASTEPDNSGAARAFDRNKIAFQNSDNKPLLSVVLIDVGDDGIDREALLTFSFPITFALDPAETGAESAAIAYQANGFEVLALTPSGEFALEASEKDSDLVAALDAHLQRIPSAVGLLDGVAAQLQQSPPLAGQVIKALARSGHGLVTYDIGLNSTDQKARSAGLPSGTVFRVLDGDLEKSDTIKRYLDRAVLEAGKDGHVIVLGRSYPDTVTALFSWAVSAKSATVALAPVSASMSK